jgi:hypothetical protein
VSPSSPDTIGNYHSFPLRENRIKATGKKIWKADAKLKRGVTLRIAKEETFQFNKLYFYL